MNTLREQIAKEIALGRSGNRPDRETADRILKLIIASAPDQLRPSTAWHRTESISDAQHTS